MLYRGMPKRNTPPLWHLFGCYALHLAIATGAAIGLFWASLGSVIIFRFLVFFCALLWVNTETLENLVRKWIFSKQSQQIALFTLNVKVYVLAFLCFGFVTNQRDRNPEWFIATLIVAALWWGVSRGHAMVKWLSR
jgi:hypothetical protein